MAFSRKNIQSAFKAIGVFPMHRDKNGEKEFLPLDVTDCTDRFTSDEPVFENIQLEIVGDPSGNVHSQEVGLSMHKYNELTQSISDTNQENQESV